ncbi:MAG: alpha/beta fold hydrolase [Planctomycetota bacterium]|jgi:pimeloyl-ACP methyl ester carboxylesterase
MRIRTYGTSGPIVVVLHGGPGAPGHMAPVARGLAESFRVLEPFQRGSGEEPLTVARHVADLLELIETRAEGARPALVGSSWGAMLALAYAAAHPDRAGPLVLIGCGTFDRNARARLVEILDERTDDDLRTRMERVSDEVSDPDERLRALGDLIDPLYVYDPLPGDEEGEPCDDQAHHETWDDMVRLQDEGVYPTAFAAIETPVLMLHGAYDPHPGRMIRDGLAPHIPQLSYVEWDRCGHYPWRERAVRDEFFAVLESWLARQLGSDRGTTSRSS